MRKNGAALILTFLIMVTTASVVIGFLLMISTQARETGSDAASSKALWLAEAGLQKAIWNLKTPLGSGGQGEDWETTGTTESLGDGNYTMLVDRWDFAHASDSTTGGGFVWAVGMVPATASVSSETMGHPGPNAFDTNETTYWESVTASSPADPESITATFPSALMLNKVTFLVPEGSLGNKPVDYTWEVSSDGVNFSPVVTKTGNNAMFVTDTFTAVPNVSDLKLNVTQNAGAATVQVAIVEAVGSKITSTGTVSGVKRKVEVAVIADDATQTAYTQKDWDEVVQGGGGGGGVGGGI